VLFFCDRSCKSDFSYGISMFYGNIMSVIGYIGIRLWHLLHTFCFVRLWIMDRSDYHRLNVIWNNILWSLDVDRWRENVLCLSLVLLPNITCADSWSTRRRHWIVITRLYILLWLIDAALEWLCLSIVYRLWVWKYMISVMCGLETFVDRPSACDSGRIHFC